jgi:hypothetical protein
MMPPDYYALYIKLLGESHELRAELHALREGTGTLIKYANSTVSGGEMSTFNTLCKSLDISPEMAPFAQRIWNASRAALTEYHDRPDFIGGIGWAQCEIDWINSRVRRRPRQGARGRAAGGAGCGT